MADIVSPQKRSQNMSAIRSKNTKLEHDKLKALYADYFVKNRKGVFEYILGGCTDTRLLDIRIFGDAAKRTVYERQTADVTARCVSNRPTLRPWQRQQQTAYL